METETTKFPNGGKAIVEQIQHQKKERNPKEQDCENYSLRQIQVGKLTI